jgi:BR serine/threonine kinase
VVRGQHTETGEAVAVKLLDMRSSGKRAGSSEAAILREVSAMRRACATPHANIVQLRGWWRIDGLAGGGSCHAFALELCNGGELFKLVERHGALPEARVRPLFSGIFSGLSHLHSVGVAHRDLKLENVLLGGEGNATPKICDLGLAHVHAPREGGDGMAHKGHRDAWEDSRLRQFCGSRSYCAPEVMARCVYDGFIADVWSLMVCLFGLAAGFFPVDEATTRDWRYEKIVRLQHFEPHSSTTKAIFGFYGRACPFSPALVSLLDGMLPVEPSARISLAQVEASAWFAGDAPPPPSDPSQLAAELVITEDAGLRADPLLEVDLSEEVYRAHGHHEVSAAASRDPPRLTRQRAVSECVGLVDDTEVGSGGGE